MIYFLGVDIGTTSSKAVAFSPSGEVLGIHAVHYEMHHPAPGYSEQDPDEIFEAVITAINTVLQSLAPELPAFVCFSAAMHSLIAVGKENKLLTKCIIWADNRADLIAQKLRASKAGEAFYHRSGVPIHSMSPLCKLLWLRENEPATFAAAQKFIGIKEYVFYKLFGEYVIDTSIASATGLLNISSLQWDEEILKYAAVDASRLPNIVSTKNIFYYNNHFSGISIKNKIPFVIGASDGALSNLGTGATSSNAMAITIGTSAAARMVIDAPKTDSRMRTFCYHLKDNLYIAGGANNNGAVVLQWLKETLLQTNEDYDQLFEAAKTIAAGSDDLILLPYILGERAPIWNANATGVYFGLNIAHTKAHLVRATLEGVIFSIYSIAKILTEQFKVTELHASGGFAKSTLWLQMLADVANIKVIVSDTVESSALGAVMLGAEAMQIQVEFKNNVLSTFLPISANNKTYQKQFAKFERLYYLLKSEMTNQSENLE